MPTFEYIALDPQGGQTTGTIAAESQGAARRQLRTRKLHVTKLKEVSTAARQRLALGGLKGRRRRKVLEFSRQLATMVEADVQLTEALMVLISQEGHSRFGQVIHNVRDQVLGGEGFADSLKQYPGYFDQIYTSMVRVGEATGNLGKSLTLLVEYMSKRQRLEAKVKSALIYPAFLVVVAVVVTVFLMTKVVPDITKIILERGQQLPKVTQILISISNLFMDYWWLMLLLAFLLPWAFKKVLATKKGKRKFDEWLLKIPALGELIRQTIVARFTSTLAALIRSGLPMADSMQVVADVVGNEVLAQAVRNARERIIAGADVATPLRESKVVGAAVAHMIAVGERSGELERMLITISEGLDEMTDITVGRISSIIEPVIIVIMAGIVGFIVVGTLLPIFQISNIG